MISVDHPTDQFILSKGPSSTFRFLVLAYPTQHDKLCDDRPAVISLCNQALKLTARVSTSRKNRWILSKMQEELNNNTNMTQCLMSCSFFLTSLFRPTLPSFFVWRSSPLRCCHVSAHRWRVGRVRRFAP